MNFINFSPTVFALIVWTVIGFLLGMHLYVLQDRRGTSIWYLSRNLTFRGSVTVILLLGPGMWLVQLSLTALDIGKAMSGSIWTLLKRSIRWWFLGRKKVVKDSYEESRTIRPMPSQTSGHHRVADKKVVGRTIA